jgi:hypothetical protein
MPIRKITLILALATIAACKPATPDPAADRSNSATATATNPSQKEASMQDAHQDSTRQLQPPRPDSVLYFISDIDGDGALEYETANGSWIHYWYGFEFELGGTRYYTGFAWETPEIYGAERENHYPAPDTPVTLAQATFVASEAGSKSPWTFQGAELYIGNFGGRERGNTVDPARKPQTHTTQDGRLVLAVPSWSLQSGISVLSYDVLVFNPRESSDVNDTHWTYVGNLHAGYDNTTNCGEDVTGNPPCVKNSSTLAFVEQPGLPTLRVTVSGDPAAQGGDATIEYRYDTGRKSYLPAP